MIGKKITILFSAGNRYSNIDNFIDIRLIDNICFIDNFCFIDKIIDSFGVIDKKIEFFFIAYTCFSSKIRK